MEPEKIPRERTEDLISLLVPDWRPTRQEVLWAIRLAIVFGVLIAIGYRYDITLWDWLKLLIVPVVIAGGGIWFNRQQRQRELEIAERRTQDDALQAYLDQMSAMLIPNKDQPSLYKARPGDGLSSVARARTLTVLPRLDGNRKARVVQFLYESGLISGRRPVLDLRGADLRKVSLIGANLRGANLSRADLRGAALAAANLNGTYLLWAKLRGASLSMAHLEEGAILVGADLRGANLNSARLIGADLRWAGLYRTNLRGAKLSQADVDVEELEKSILEGATMPNGQKYEEWRKDR